MIKTVYKYELVFKNEQILELPVNSKILDVQYQNNQLYAWVLLNKHHGPAKQKHTIELYDTGQDISYEMGARRNYLKTLQVNDSTYHVFEYLGF